MWEARENRMLLVNRRSDLRQQWRWRSGERERPTNHPYSRRYSYDTHGRQGGQAGDAEGADATKRLRLTLPPIVATLTLCDRILSTAATTLVVIQQY